MGRTSVSNLDGVERWKIFAVAAAVFVAGGWAGAAWVGGTESGRGSESVTPVDTLDLDSTTTDPEPSATDLDQAILLRGETVQIQASAPGQFGVQIKVASTKPSVMSAQFVSGAYIKLPKAPGECIRTRTVSLSIVAMVYVIGDEILPVSNQAIAFRSDQEDEYRDLFSCEPVTSAYFQGLLLSLEE